MRFTSLAGLGVVAGALLATGVAAQRPQPTQEELVELRQKKLAKPVFEGWIQDYDAAREKAAAEGKLIFAYFTRSYAH